LWLETGYLEHLTQRTLRKELEMVGDKVIPIVLQQVMAQAVPVGRGKKQQPARPEYAAGLA
jgi:hypothetical protein